MRDQAITLALGKLMIVAAWADGEIQQEEVDCLKDLLYQLPELPDDAWHCLEEHMKTPIQKKERELIIEELTSLITSSEEKEFTLYALEKIIEADGTITHEEERIFQEIKAALASSKSELLSKIEVLIREPIQRRETATKQTPKSTNDFNTFFHNDLFIKIKDSINEGKIEVDLPEGELRKLGLAGSLMARVARVNPRITEQDLEYIASIIQEYWSLSTEGALFVSKIALSQSVFGMDGLRLCRQFHDITTSAERNAFLDALFDVALADGRLTHPEMEEIMEIAANLKISQSDFEKSLQAHKVA